MSNRSVLALVPARGGSKGLPGKNIRPLAGLPLIAHSILMARQCGVITQLVVSTDSDEIAAVARQFDATVLARPGALAQDDTPMWPVVRHALDAVEAAAGQRFDYVLLLDPTSPGRVPADVDAALERLEQAGDAVGIVGVSQPEFNPIWHCVIERDGSMVDLIPEGDRYVRRQDVPAVYRINATLYLWRAEFVRREQDSWRNRGRHLMHVIPEARAIHIDDADEFARADLMIRQGLLRLPWLEKTPA